MAWLLKFNFLEPEVQIRTWTVMMGLKFQISGTEMMKVSLQRILNIESVCESLNSFQLHLKFFADRCNGNMLERGGKNSAVISLWIPTVNRCGGGLSGHRIRGPMHLTTTAELCFAIAERNIYVTIWILFEQNMPSKHLIKYSFISKIFLYILTKFHNYLCH